MPLKLRMNVGDNVFEAEGDFEFGAGVSDLLRQWLNGLGDETGAALEAATDALEHQTQQLADAVAATTPAA